MKFYTQQELEEKYKQLPAAIEEAIFGIGAEKTLEEIGKKYKLQIDRLGILANETRLVMLGLTHPKNFINNLAERLELNEENAKNIAQEINQRIFYEIREELKKMHDISPTIPKPKTQIFPPQAKKFRIQDLKKEKLPEPPPIIKPPTTELPTIKPPPAEPAEKPKISATPFEYKLKSEKAVRAPLEEIKISTEDPYREPIE